MPSTSAPRSLTSTFAPWRANSRACSRPIPLPPPVTMTIRPSQIPLTCVSFRSGSTRRHFARWRGRVPKRGAQAAPSPPGGRRLGRPAPGLLGLLGGCSAAPGLLGLLGGCSGCSGVARPAARLLRLLGLLGPCVSRRGNRLSAHSGAPEGTFLHRDPKMAPRKRRRHRRVRRGAPCTRGAPPAGFSARKSFLGTFRRPGGHVFAPRPQNGAEKPTPAPPVDPCAAAASTPSR